MTYSQAGFRQNLNVTSRLTIDDAKSTFNLKTKRSSRNSPEIGGQYQTMKGKIQAFENQSNNLISIPTVKPKKAYDPELTRKSTFKTRANSTQHTFGGFTSKRGSHPGYQTSAR